jgi:DNA primase large subunit
MEESITYWKSEFTRKHDIDAEKFEKNYAYNIRHSYG